MEEIYVVGVGMTPFGRLLDKDIKTLTREAVDAALADAGLRKEDLQGAFFGNASQGHMDGQQMIRGQIALREAGIGRVPVVNVENACASGSSAFALAVMQVRAGAADVALAVGAEKMFSTDKAQMFSVFDSAWDVSRADEIRDRLLQMGHGVEVPEGSTSPKPYSVFMDVYAAFARSHMRRWGTTQRQLAAVAAKNHAHSVHNSLSQYRTSYTIDEVLAAAPITYPLTLRLRAALHRARLQARLRDRRCRTRRCLGGGGARRHGDGRDHPDREPRLLRLRRRRRDRRARRHPHRRPHSGQPIRRVGVQGPSGRCDGPGPDS